MGASIGASFATSDVFGALLIVSPAPRFELDATRCPAVDDAGAVLNGILNGTRNCAVLLSSTSHSKLLSLTKLGIWELVE